MECLYGQVREGGIESTRNIGSEDYKCKNYKSNKFCDSLCYTGVRRTLEIT